jgi:hypothetical protein
VIDKLDSDIAKLERVIGERTAQLKIAQDRWDDWRAGTLRAAIGVDQISLHNLKVRRASMALPSEMKASAIFYGSNS